MTSSASRYFTSLFRLLEDLSLALSLYGAYEDMFFENPRFQGALMVVYTDIIAILDKARRALRKSSTSSLLNVPNSIGNGE